MFKAQHLKTRFLLVGIASTVVLVSLVIFDYYGRAQQKASTSLLSDISAIIQRHMKADMMHDAIDGDVMGVIFANLKKDANAQREAEKSFQEHVQEFEENLKLNIAVITKEEIKSKIKQSADDFRKYRVAGEVLFNNVINNSYAPKDLENFRAEFSNMEKGMESISDDLEKWIVDEVRISEESLHITSIIIVVLSLFSIGLAFIIPVYALIGIFRPLEKITGVMNLISKGERTEIPNLNSKNEIGDIARALKEVDDIGQSALRIKSALDCSSGGVMIADKDYNISYINPALHSMLKKEERHIQRDLPNFEADKLIGGNIDQFHKNPSHQRNILERLIAPHDAQITVGGVILRFKATPIFSKTRERVGVVVEWSNLTEEKQIEQEVSDIVSACAAGNFNSRIKLEGKSGFMRTLSEGMNKISDTTLSGLMEAKDILNELAHGNLTRSMTGNYQGIFEEIKSSVNGTISKLSEMVDEIRLSTESVNSASQEIASGSQDLAHRTEEQASTLEQTAASMEEMTSTVRQNADNAKQADSLSAASNKIASDGYKVVLQAVEAMGEIQNSSQKIADIIGVIDDIAFQTNLLALNAAVEAARAGEAGKGFAVVASEVRALAGRSAEASKEIKGLITKSVELINNGSQYVNKSGDTFKEIANSVDKVAQLIKDITSASTEQSRGIDEINVAVSQMDDATQQNAALVEENTAAARSMADQVAQLEQLIRFFKVSTDNADYSAPQKLVSSSASHKTTNASAPKKKSAPAKKSALAHVASNASSSNDGWEEF